MDKVKAQANQLAQKTQVAAQEGKARIDQAQANRRGEALLRQLGAAVYADRTGHGTPDTPAKIDQLISDISAHERESGLSMTSPPSGGPQPNVPQPGYPPDNPFPGQAGSTYPPAGSSSDAGQAFPPPGGGPDAGTSFPPPGTQFFPPPGDGDAESGGTRGY
ncbi:MAG TPA: hypothetical protein VLM11_23595 [Streptosporangiaceae bacterium]|nr:hypothetical protein [Streptosporangiaceae bacterium]